MYIVFLNFSSNKSRAPELMAGHNEWIQQGFEDDVFALVGSHVPNLGGAIVAHNTTLDELQARLKNDPFVMEDVVTTEIHEIAPAKADPRLQFLVS